MPRPLDVEGSIVSALSDVARIAAVSKATASRALSGRGYVSATTRDRVVAAAAQLGYVVSSNATGLVTGTTRTIGVVIPHINQWYFAEILEGIESELISAGYDLTLYRLSDDPAVRLRVFEHFLVRKRVDAVIAVGIDLARSEIGLVSSLHKPIVGIGGPINGVATLGIDDVAASALVTQHMVSLGHARIAHLGGDPDHERDFCVHAQRLEGFRQVMDAADLDPTAFVVSELSIPGGYAAALALLADPRSRPTAIVAGCDEVAIGAIVAARQLGIQVPSQLSIIGIDGHVLGEMFGLTTVAQNPRAQGHTAVRLIVDDLMPARAPTASTWHPHPATLVVRSSTTAPPA